MPILPLGGDNFAVQATAFLMLVFKSGLVFYLERIYVLLMVGSVSHVRKFPGYLVGHLGSMNNCLCYDLCT